MIPFPAVHPKMHEQQHFFSGLPVHLKIKKKRVLRYSVVREHLYSVVQDCHSSVVRDRLISNSYVYIDALQGRVYSKAMQKDERYRHSGLPTLTVLLWYGFALERAVPVKYRLSVSETLLPLTLPVDTGLPHQFGDRHRAPPVQTEYPIRAGRSPVNPMHARRYASH